MGELTRASRASRHLDRFHLAYQLAGAAALLALLPLVGVVTSSAVFVGLIVAADAVALVGYGYGVRAALKRRSPLPVIGAVVSTVVLLPFLFLWSGALMFGFGWEAAGLDAAASASA